jgi:uncharacterized protein
MFWKRLENDYQLSFELGEPWPATFDGFLVEHGIEWGSFSALGAVQRVRFGFYPLSTKQWDEHQVFEELEVCSWTGNVAVRDGKPFAHTHAVFGRKDGSTFGGHVLEATIGATLELVLAVLSGRVERQRDSDLGLWLLRLPERFVL